MHHRAGCHNEIPSFTGWSAVQELNDQHLPPSMQVGLQYLKPAGQRLPPMSPLPNPLGFVGETGPAPDFLGHRYAPLLTAATPGIQSGHDITKRPEPVMIRGMPRISDSRLIDGAGEPAARRQSLLSRLDVEPAVRQRSRSSISFSSGDSTSSRRRSCGAVSIRS